MQLSGGTVYAHYSRFDSLDTLFAIKFQVPVNEFRSIVFPGVFPCCAFIFVYCVSLISCSLLCSTKHIIISWDNDYRDRNGIVVLLSLSLSLIWIPESLACDAKTTAQTLYLIITVAKADQRRPGKKFQTCLSFRSLWFEPIL